MRVRLGSLIDMNGHFYACHKMYLSYFVGHKNLFPAKINIEKKQRKIRWKDNAILPSSSPIHSLLRKHISMD